MTLPLVWSVMHVIADWFWCACVDPTGVTQQQWTDLIVQFRQKIEHGTLWGIRWAFSSPSPPTFPPGHISVSLRLWWWVGRRPDVLGEQKQVCVGQCSLGPSLGASLLHAQHWCFLTEKLGQLLEWGGDENSKADLASRVLLMNKSQSPVQV